MSLLNFGLPSIGPGLRDEFDLSLAQLGAVLTASILGSGLALMPAGILVDRYGGRAVTLTGSALGAASLLGAAFAPSTWTLLVLLFTAGIGLSAIPIAGIGSLFHAYGPERRGWALGVRQMAVPAGGVIGAVLLPGLEALGGARLALGAGAAAVALTCIRFAAVAGGAPVAVQRPLSGLRRIWRTPGMPRLLLVAALYIVVLSTMITYVVPSARDAGLSAFAAGAAFFVLNVTAGVARVVWGRFADGNGGTRRTASLVGTGWVAAIGGLVFALALHGGPFVVLPAVVLFAFGGLGWNALVYVCAGERAAPELAGQAVALAATLVFLLAAASTPPMGALAEHAGWDVVWLTTAGLAGAGAVVAAGLVRTREEPVTA